MSADYMGKCINSLCHYIKCHYLYRNLYLLQHQADIIQQTQNFESISHKHNNTIIITK